MFEDFKELILNRPIVRGTRITPRHKETTHKESKPEPDLPPELYVKVDVSIKAHEKE